MGSQKFRGKMVILLKKGGKPFQKGAQIVPNPRQGGDPFQAQMKLGPLPK